jgi:cyclopropane-fatty-acyl-phospholipid synthase
MADATGHLPADEPSGQTYGVRVRDEENSRGIIMRVDPGSGEASIEHKRPRSRGPEITALLALARRLRRGSLEIVLPDGELVDIAGGEPGLSARIELKNGRVVRRYAFKGALGFAESFVDGDWDSPDLAKLLRLFETNADAFADSYYGGFVSRSVSKAIHALRSNTKAGSRRNIKAHYDLGNAFFAAWLDPTMLYSSALFRDGARDLATAQLAKCRNLARLIALEPGERLLEIGSGWGTFAILAAKEFGAKVTSITISDEQLDFARRRVFEEKLNEQVEIRFQDYRDVAGTYDKIASIEMFEAVGENYWPTFFAKIRDRLAPSGLAGLQVITIADEYFDEYRRAPDFIQHYIFPGGMLPSLATLDQHYAEASLAKRAETRFGQDYARTLSIWGQHFARAWPRISTLGFDERFRRIWSFYLGYCEAGFSGGSIDVSQIVLART